MRPFIFCLLVFSGFGCFAQLDDAGSGRAVRFDGLDDYVDLGNILDDLPAAFTVSAWIYVDPTATGALPILVSQDNADLYNGFWFFVNPTAVWIEMGDGKGFNLPAYRKGKQAIISDIRGKWVHVAAVVRSTFDIDLYVNGQNVGGYSTGESSLPMASNYPTDVAKAGYFYSNNIVYRFKGIMDEVRVWKRPLSETEIRSRMCKRVLPADPDLIGYWGFDETSGTVIKDYSVKASTGKLINNPTRVYSGAPVGDESTFMYQNFFTTQTLTMDNIKVSHVNANALGVHIYKVSKNPSQIEGLDPSKPMNPYYGIFIATTGTQNTFNIDQGIACTSSRIDNSVATWSGLTSATGISQRIELLTAVGSIKFSLGPDTVLCDHVNYAIDSKVPASGNNFKWNTGQTTPAIQVTTPGLYILTASNNCAEKADSVLVGFVNSVPEINLGPDFTLCDKVSHVIKTKLPVQYDGLSLWSTGQTGGTIEVNKSGTYWVVVSNFCGSMSDTLHIENSEHIGDIPNVFTPNDDSFNQTFELPVSSVTSNQLVLYNRWGEVVYSDPNYSNDWDGGGLPSGVYYYQLRTVCDGEKRGTVTIAK